MLCLALPVFFAQARPCLSQIVLHQLLQRVRRRRFAAKFVYEIAVNIGMMVVLYMIWEVCKVVVAARPDKRAVGTYRGDLSRR